MDISYIILSVAVLLPGFIVFKTFKRFSYVENMHSFEYTLHSIFYSILIWAFILLLVKVIHFFNSFELFRLSDLFYIFCGTIVCLIITIILFYCKVISEVTLYILISILSIPFLIICIYHLFTKLTNNTNISIKKFIDNIYSDNIFFILLLLLTVYAISFVISFVVGRLYFKFREKIKDKYVDIFKKTYYPNVWDEMFEKLFYDENISDKTILIKTLSKEFFIGNIYAVSDYSGDKGIYFSKVQKYDNTEKGFLPVAMNRGFFIPSKNIEYIHILPDVEEFDFDNYCKNEEIDLELEKYELKKFEIIKDKKI